MPDSRVRRIAAEMCTRLSDSKSTGWDISKHNIVMGHVPVEERGFEMDESQVTLSTLEFVAALLRPFSRFVVNLVGG